MPRHTKPPPDPLLREEGEPPCRLDRKVALVTGGGAGLGRAYALALADAGAAVVVNDVGVGVDGRPIAGGGPGSVVQDIRRRGGRGIGVLESVSHADGVERLVGETLAAFGRLDIVGQQRRYRTPSPHCGHDRRRF